MTFLYILLFILCLSTLIMVHEAGHLITAKIFKVYCFEYALGFGPRLLSFKRKKGETRFSIRAIPFGGFVSMYGEADAVPREFEGVEIDPSRSINNIKHWKRAIIMTAGILMNFVLAMVVFFIVNIAFPTYTARTAHVTIRQDSIAYNAGVRSQDYVFAPRLSYGDSYYIFYDDNADMNYLSSPTKKAFMGFDYTKMTIKNTDISDKAVVFEKVQVGDITTSATILTYEQFFNKEYVLDTEDYLLSGYFHWAGHKDRTVYFYLTENYLDTDNYMVPLEGKRILANVSLSEDDFKKFVLVPDGIKISIMGNVVKEVINEGEEPTIFLKSKEYRSYYPKVEENLIKQNNLSPSTVDFAIDVFDEDNKTLKGHHPISVSVTENNNLDGNLGISMQLDERRNSYGESVTKSFKDFGNSTTLIFRGLGSLFTRDGWKNVGGIIAIGVATTQTLEQNGFGNFLFMWAMISVNLGIVNLLPFPGLDGWQFLVTIVEGVAHKEIPPKVKNTVSAVGIMLLFALMILIVIKDIIMVV